MSAPPTPTDTPSPTEREDLPMKSAYVQKEGSPKRYTDDASRWVYGVLFRSIE